MNSIKTFFVVFVTLITTQVLQAQCNSAFTYNGTSPTFVFSVTSLSPGDVVSWDFGDGTTSNQTSPSHTFPFNGHFWVHLEVTNGSCIDTSGVAIYITNLSPAPCDPTFTSTNSGTTYSFTTTNPEPFYNYYWSFGDGSTSTASNPTHTYASNGAFNVTCTLQNTQTYYCSSNYTMTITISSFACNASFNSSNSFNLFQFNPSSTPSSPVGAYSYNWDFGDGTTAITTNMNSVNHAYSSIGNYSVTCNLIDGACSNTVVNSVTVSSIYNTTCDASFNISGVGPNFSFQLNSQLGQYTNIYWDYGDGQTGYSNSHNYYTNGTYTVSCMISDSITSCTDTAYNSLTVVNMGSTTIQGTINMGNTTADIGTVYLIFEDSNANSLTAVDSVSIGVNGSYAFNSVPSGDYYVKAALDPASIGYSNYLPTYRYNNSYGKLYWSDANYVYSPNNNAFYNFKLISGTNPGGPGFVGGFVSQGANKVGDPIENSLIIVTDLNMNPIAFTYSDPSGQFEIQDLPYGDYLLYPEVMGKSTTPKNFTLSASNQNVEHFSVEINSTSVNVSITTGIQPVQLFSDVRLYPNPVQHELTIDFGVTISSEVTIEVIDITGRQVSVLDVTNTHTARVNTSTLNTGTYLLKLTNSEGTQIFRFVK